jgi:hypothetical protein
MAAEVGDAGERLLVGAAMAPTGLGIGCTASPPGCSQPPGIKPRDPERRPQARLGVARLA